MKRFEIKNLLLFICLFITTIGIAQTQHGYVKTRGRLDSKGKLIPGKGLKGATIFIKGRTSVLVKDTTGAFSFPTPAKQFRVDSVRKNGYQLVDLEFCYKTRNYSSTPLDILMEVPGQSIEDYMEDFNKINASQQAMINQLRAEVKELKAQNKINEVEYNRRLSEIASMQSENQKLVKEMAERYSRMDFDRLDDFEKQVSWLILNGELIKADSLINSQGSMEELAAELDSIHNVNEKEKAVIDERTGNWEKSKKYEDNLRERFASKCYSKYEICILRHDNDSAAYWLELRASKDTLSFDYVWECGSFLLNERKYEKAKKYLELLSQNETLSDVEKAIAYNDLSICYIGMGDTLLSISTMKKSLDIRTELAESDSSRYKVSLALAASNYAAQNSFVGEHDIAERYFEIGMRLYRELEQELPFFAVNLANVEENYARELRSKALFDEAEKYYLKSYKTRCDYAERYPELYNTTRTIPMPEIERLLGQINTDVILTKECKMILRSEAEVNKERIASHAIAMNSFYIEQGDMEKGQFYLNEGREKMEILFDENPNKYFSDLSYCYWASSYYYLYVQHDTVACKRYINKNIELLSNHTIEQKKETWQYLFDSYFMLASIHADDLTYSIEKMEEACDVLLSMDESTIIENGQKLIEVYDNLGDLYGKNLEFDKADEVYNNIIRLVVDGDNEAFWVSFVKIKKAFICFQKNNIEDARALLASVISIIDAYSAIFSKLDCAWVYYYYGVALYRLQENVESVSALKTALKILEGVDGDDQVSEIKNNIHYLLDIIK